AQPSRTVFYRAQSRIRQRFGTGLPGRDFAVEYEAFRRPNPRASCEQRNLERGSGLMLEPLMYRALNNVVLAASWHGVHEFERALPDPGSEQRNLLLGLLRRNRDSAYGRQYGFGSIRSVEEYQEHLPIVTYDDLVGSIERMKAGESAVLTSEPVL